MDDHDSIKLANIKEISEFDTLMSDMASNIGDMDQEKKILIMELLYLIIDQQSKESR